MDLRLRESVWTVTGEARLVSKETSASKETVYNLEVDGYHTYFVGDFGVWVHNDCTGGGHSCAAKGGSSLLTHIPSAGRKANQLARRGWTREAINDTVNNPFTTRAATNRATGNPATAFFREDGSHVIRDNVTGDLVQMSDRTNPSNWVPDSSIVNPYVPGQ
ncbi:MAG: hypothetical protein DWQ01_09170 [Planctomycetota bacterium]|nr:MAG: hypothetical protein DWQ01_09170 [Planctomycetota bacterium]